MTKTNQYASTTLTINLQAIRENYNILKNQAKGSKVSAVVKANAYGLGVAEVASVLVCEGCNTFFVANLDEAIELRNLLSNIAIFVLHGIVPGQEEAFTENRIIPVLNSKYQIDIWQRHAVNNNKKLPCILHFDTGMNRLGIYGYRHDGALFNQNISFNSETINSKEQLSPEPVCLSQIPALDIKYIMTHLSCSDDKSHPKNEGQLKEFHCIARNFEGVMLSIANSGGIFLGNDYHLDMVRPGVAIYGVNPSIKLPNPMKSVVNLTSKILQIERVDRAGTVGYGAMHNIAIGTKIATIAVGYADGYLRSLSNSGICAVDGVFVPVIGRVSMDLVTLDVTKIPDSKLAQGVEIELIGDNIPVDILAQKAGTIGYEILTSLGTRYKRIYK